MPPREQSDRVTAEAELAIVIGRTCNNVSEAEADSVIAGFLPIINLTVEDVFQRNPRFLTGVKSYGTFLVVGDVMTGNSRRKPRPSGRGRSRPRRWREQPRRVFHDYWFPVPLRRTGVVRTVPQNDR
nr:fumarylacetoacetate hydrolase family protein [Haladaptatus pallidirubidus]